MKKIFALIVSVVALAACTAPAPKEVTNANATATPAKTVVAMTESEAIVREKAVWESIQRKDYDAFAAVIASDSIEVNPSEVHDKAGSVAGLKQFEPTDVVFSDWKFLSLDDDAFVVTYTAKVKGKYQGKTFPEQSARASSAWVNRDGKWLSIYHQECEVTPPPPAPKATPTPAASPAAAVATATPGSDPIANEKLVWDLFKSKNYDAFASLLSDDFIQVFPYGVDNKETALKNVQFDASKAELSEWQTVKIDDDASIVIYLAKVPGMSKDGARHATIWTRRNGKWLARFHHGTTVMKQPPGAAKPSPSASVSPSASASPTASASPK